MDRPEIRLVEIGSNLVRWLRADRAEEPIRLLEKEFWSYGSSGVRPNTKERALARAEELLRRLRPRGPQFAVATASLRGQAEAEAWAARLAEALGIERVEVLDERAEAAAAREAGRAASGWVDAPVLDIGGRSTEWAASDFFVSVPVGALTLVESARSVGARGAGRSARARFERALSEAGARVSSGGVLVVTGSVAAALGAEVSGRSFAHFLLSRGLTLPAPDLFERLRLWEKRPPGAVAAAVSLPPEQDALLRAAGRWLAGIVQAVGPRRLHLTGWGVSEGIALARLRGDDAAGRC